MNIWVLCRALVAQRLLVIGVEPLSVDSLSIHGLGTGAIIPTPEQVAAIGLHSISLWGLAALHVSALCILPEEHSRFYRPLQMEDDIMLSWCPACKELRREYLIKHQGEPPTMEIGKKPTPGVVIDLVTRRRQSS